MISGASNGFHSFQKEDLPAPLLAAYSFVASSSCANMRASKPCAATKCAGCVLDVKPCPWGALPLSCCGIGTNPAGAVPSLYGRKSGRPKRSGVFSLTSHAHHSAADCCDFSCAAVSFFAAAGAPVATVAARVGLG